MNSRYSLWLVCVCCVSLAGCANWQNRARQNGAPGSAATLNASPAPAGLNLFAPDANAGMPPPPIAPEPTSHDMMMPSAGTAATADRLDLSAVSTLPPPPSAPLQAAAPVRETSRAAVPDKLYNLEKSSGSTRVASTGSGSSRKTSTISRLAKKSDSSEKTNESSTAKTSAKKESTSARQPSTLERLAREAPTGTREVAEQIPSSLPRPGTVATEPVRSTSASSSAPAEPAIAEPAPIDTSFLAQPVRKGADDEAAGSINESKGPQSRVIPNSSLFNGNDKPVIYPVSNPAVEEQVDVTQFS